MPGNIVSKHVPHKRKRVINKSNPKWFNNDISVAIRERNKVYKKYKLKPSELNKNAYNSSKRKVKRLIRLCKREYEKLIALESKENPKRFYDYVSNKKPLREEIGPIVNENGEVVSTSLGMTKQLNRYFYSVFAPADLVTERFFI